MRQALADNPILCADALFRALVLTTGSLSTSTDAEEEALKRFGHQRAKKKKVEQGVAAEEESDDLEEEEEAENETPPPQHESELRVRLQRLIIFKRDGRTIS